MLQAVYTRGPAGAHVESPPGTRAPGTLLGPKSGGRSRLLASELVRLPGAGGRAGRARGRAERCVWCAAAESESER